MYIKLTQSSWQKGFNINFQGQYMKKVMYFEPEMFITNLFSTINMILYLPFF